MSTFPTTGETFRTSQMSKMPSPFRRVPHIFILFVLILLPSQVNSQVLNNTEQVKILLDIKQHWGNPSSLWSWIPSSSPCNWQGIYCQASGIVTQLLLGDKYITGEIPPTICKLEHLSRIDLSSNKLTGNISQNLNNCSELEFLDLSANSLSGRIPGWLFRSKSLRSLLLNFNMLDGELPTPIDAFKLSTLLLSNNNLNGTIPEDFGKLDNLYHLDLSRNNFSGSIPSGLLLSHQLSYLFLDHNKLSDQIPTPIDTISMVNMDLSSNNLTGSVPEDFGNFYRLNVLDLSENQLSGDIRKIVSHLRNMSTLMLCSNKFSKKVSYDFVMQKFGKICLDDDNMCSDNKINGFSSCHSKNHKAKDGFIIIIIISCATGCVVIGLFIILYFGRKLHMKRKHDSSVLEEWEMIPFKRLNFTKWDILSNLTENNQIGKGGSGKVYRFAISQTGETVAVKKISNERKSNDRLEKEFLAEVQILGLIRHSNVVKLLCCISSKDTKLLVYEYLENHSLDRWLQAKRRDSSSGILDWPKRLKIAVGAAQGLCYMHHDCSPPIIHRDVKSSNILLDSEFNGKIADFGLAKILAKSGEPETASVVAGTFGYIAPGTYIPTLY